MSVCLQRWVLLVRQITLNFLHQRKKTKTVVESEENSLAMAFILAESNRKAKDKLKYLSPVSIPYWVVQVSDTESIILSAIGESSMTFEMSEDTALGPLKRIITSETRDFNNIPKAVEKAIPLLKEVEPITHHVRNLQDPGIITTQGKLFDVVDPNTKLNVLNLKLDSSEALNISKSFQKIVEDAQKRLIQMQEFHQLTKEKLSDRLDVLDNVTGTELARLEKKLKTLESNTEARVAKLEEKCSNTIYRMKEKRTKDQGAILAQFARDSASLERFFTQVLTDIQAFRQEVRAGNLGLDDSIQKYQNLKNHLDDTVPTYVDVADSVSEITQQLVDKASNLDIELEEKIRAEEDGTSGQIEEKRLAVGEFSKEIEAKKKEFKVLKKNIIEAVDRISGLVNTRVEGLTKEIGDVALLTIQNDSINGLTPLTLLYINTYVATYNKGAPIVFPPVLTPEDRFGLPLKHEPLSPDLEKYTRKTIKALTKSSPSFKESFEKAQTDGNVFYRPELVSSFKKGIGKFRTRQLLKEGVREKLEPAFVKLVGRCPSCNENIGTAKKFCPECGVSLT